MPTTLTPPSAPHSTLRLSRYNTMNRFRFARTCMRIMPYETFRRLYRRNKSNVVPSRYVRLVSMWFWIRGYPA